MRKIITVALTLFFFSASSQESKIILGGVSGSFENTPGSVVHYDPSGKIIFGITAHPTEKKSVRNYPFNFVNMNTSFSYFNTAKAVSVSLHFDTSLIITDMRCRITDSWSNVIINWSVPEGKRIVHNPPPNLPPGAKPFPLVEYQLPNIGCENNVISIQLYNVNNPDVILTLILSTIPIERPILFGTIKTRRNKDIPVANNTYERFYDSTNLTDMEGEHTFGVSEMDLNEAIVYLNSNNSPLVFNVHLVREVNDFRDSLLLPVHWHKMDKNDSQYTSILKKLGRLPPYNFTWFTYIPVEFIKNTGKYEIIATPKFWEDLKFYNDNTAKLSFTSNEVSHRDFSVVIKILGFIILGLLGLFFVNKSRQRKSLQTKEREIKDAKLKLQSLRSQLNPHFIFNALSGIQNLMNKNETEKANSYLNTFSRLTRNVLDDSANETITLTNEIKLLDDYLKMEQLRFGFQYNIRVDDSLDKHNIEIPSMLLQPFAENAVKHGIAALKEKGGVEIGFTKSGNDLVLSVADNGEGFDANNSYKGMGLQLSKNRISLLNTVNKNTQLDLQINSSGKGTTAIITLQNWLS